MTPQVSHVPVAPYLQVKLQLWPSESPSALPWGRQTRSFSAHSTLLLYGWIAHFIQPLAQMWCLWETPRVTAAQTFILCLLSNIP